MNGAAPVQHNAEQQESRHHDDGYAPTSYFKAFGSDRSHPRPRVDSAGNLVALEHPQPERRSQEVARTPVQPKPSRSEVFAEPADSMTVETGNVPERNLVGTTVTQPLSQEKGDDFDGFVRTEYYKSSRPGRTSFDRDSLNASNSLSDLQQAGQQ